MINLSRMRLRASFTAKPPQVITIGAIPLTEERTEISVTGTKAYTLADGQYEGQVKHLLCTVAATSPAGTITPATPFGFATILLDAVGESATLRWSVGKGWSVVGRGALSAAGATIA